MKMLLLMNLALCVALLLVHSCTNKSRSDEPTAQVVTDEQRIQRGDYLVTVIGCHDCHSPKRAGERGPEIIPELNLSGYPAQRPLEKINVGELQKGWVLFTSDLTGTAGPWGVSFAANITSDQSGIGNWTEENFIRAMKQGKYKGIEGSRTLLPPMPWENYAKMSDEDIRAVFVFLKASMPVYNVVPAAIPPAEIK